MAKRISKQDVTGEFPNALDELKAKFGALDTAISASDALINKFKSDISKLRKEISGIDVSSVKGAKELAEKQREANKIMMETAKLEQENIKLLTQKERLKQAELRTEKMLNAEKKKTLTAYQQESKALNDMRNRYKDLAVQKEKGVKLTKEETKEYRQLIKQINQTDSMLKKVDASTGQFQRNVGNYPKVINGFSSALSQLGVAFGTFQLINSGKDALIEFENAIASFRTIVSDLNNKEFEVYKSQIKAVADETKRSNTEIANSFEAIAGLNSSFAETADGLGTVSKAVTTLADASGDDMSASASNLVGIMNQFDLAASEADRAINVLAAGQAVGASSITQSAEAYKNFGAVAKGANITLEESQALIQVLGKSSIFGAEAGTKLRGVTLQLQKANLGYASGQFDINDALEDFNNVMASKTSASEKDAYATKIFGAENITAGKIISNNTELFNDYTKSVTGTTEAQKAAEINTNTLANRWIQFKNAIENAITSGDGVGGFLDGLKDGLKFLTDNLSTIITLLITLGKLFLVYKARLIAINVAQKLFSDGAGKMNVSLKQMVSNFKDASSGGSKLGGALKGIGWTAIIALAWELGTELYRIASGAAQAEEDLARMEKTAERALSSTNKNIEGINKRLAERMRLIQNRINSGELKGEKAINAEKEKAIALSRKELYNSAIEVRNRRVRFQDLRAEVKQIEAKIKADQKIGIFSERQFARLKEIQKEINMKGDVGLFGLMQEDATAIDILAQLDANINATRKSSAEYYKELKNVNDQTEELESLTKGTTRATKENTKVVQEQIKAYKDANELIQRQIDLEREAVDIRNELLQYETGRDLDEELSSQLKNIDKEGQYGIDRLNELLQKEYDLKKEAIERQYQLAIEGQQNEQLILNERAKADLELLKLEEENIGKRKDVYKQLEDAQEEFSTKSVEKTEEVAKKNYDNERKYIELTTTFLEDQIDKRIALLEKEIEAHQKQQDYFRALAESGNINAQQSLAEEARLQREAEVEKMKLERRKQYIQAVSAFLTDYTNRIEKGESSTQALTGALASKAMLEAMISSMPAFFEGTEDTGKVSNALDSNGGRLSILHDNERVMTKRQNMALGGISNEEVVKYTQLGMISESIEKGNSSWQDLTLMNELNGLRGDVKELTKVVKNKPETDYQYEEAIKGVLSITKTTRKGGNVTRNKIHLRP